MRRTSLVLPIAAMALTLGALPGLAHAATDRDGDGMADRWEKRYRVSSANGDGDRDRVDNRNEYREGTSPRAKDSDGDGRSDGREDRDRDRLSNAAEDATGNDPADRDTDNDGIPDGKEQAGVVSAYENGSLTIELATGGSVTATVTDRTDVDCATEAVAESTPAGATASHRGPGGRDGDGVAESRSGGIGCDGCREGRDEVECPEGTLAVGAKIHEATLKTTSAGAVWSRSRCWCRRPPEPMDRTSTWRGRLRPPPPLTELIQNARTFSGGSRTRV